MVRQDEIQALKDRATQVRRELLTMIFRAQSGHPGGSLSATDVVTALYFSELKVDPENPGWADRDRFVLSKGHVCPVLYTVLGLRGFFGRAALYTLRAEGSILQGHPDMKRCPGIDISTGSLGQGLSAAVGMALAAKRDDRDYRVFCLLGDGETNEGQVWEAVQTAEKYRLDNLVILVDQNGLQNDGFCADILPASRTLADKFRAFGCNTLSVDGHSMEEITEAFERIRGKRDGKPHALVLKTVKGKGVSYMENVASWHGMAPSQDEYAQAMAELGETAAENETEGSGTG